MLATGSEAFYHSDAVTAIGSAAARDWGIIQDGSGLHVSARAPPEDLKAPPGLEDLPSFARNVVARRIDEPEWDVHGLHDVG
ncbi:hypothetical protein PG997_010045 [Apiospora hydei]|uniref:Uncharacterized protein n=1 Tax=Apiospora hydei TaxID=1337664 RepID=A0ABR1VX03_9PEZI